MKADGDILITLAVQFAIMSLLAFGGANAVVPEMHRQAVELRGIEPIGADLSACIGNIECGTIADEPSRTAGPGGGFIETGVADRNRWG